MITKLIFIINKANSIKDWNDYYKCINIYHNTNFILNDKLKNAIINSKIKKYH